MKEIEFTIVDFQSEKYLQTVELRREILRRPLGIDFSEEQLAKENADIHLVGLLDNQVIACLILTPEVNHKIKMRQVAVDQRFQSQGVGKNLIAFAEKTARMNGFLYMHCNARETAVAFYLKNGYLKSGDVFHEVNLPHYYMSKML